MQAWRKRLPRRWDEGIAMSMIGRQLCDSGDGELVAYANSAALDDVGQDAAAEVGDKSLPQALVKFVHEGARLGFGSDVK